jgi:ATP-dependent exoDNAse (exonuclease V) beta subunit
VDVGVASQYKMKTFIHHDLPKLERDTKPDGTRVYKTPTGFAYPSVTTVTGLHTAKGIAEWRKRVGNEEANRVSAKASSRGTRIHGYCEDYLRGNLFEADMFDLEMFNSIKPLLDQIDNIHCLEDQLYSDHLQVAGTVDCIAEFQGKLSVIDFKTASRPKDRDDIYNYFMQTAAYAVAFEERTRIPIGRLVIIMAVENDDPRWFIEKRDNWVGGFRKLRLEYKHKYNI